MKKLNSWFNQFVLSLSKIIFILIASGPSSDFLNLIQLSHSFK